jgi:putative selenium metabolism hydrolase
MIDKTLLEESRQLVGDHREEIIALAQRLVRLPSLSGNEGAVAAAVWEAMQQLDYDDVRTDAAGNVIGLVKGGDGPSTIFNGHMDVVDAGQPEDWSHPPFGAEIRNGFMWGRGSADMKCALAAMVFAAGLFKQGPRPPRGDVLVTAVPMEEIGGWGTHLLLRDGALKADRAVVGEPTNNRLLPGHRARMVLLADIKGRSRHSSLADHEANPLFTLARFINALPQVTASLQEQLGYLTITPTVNFCPPGDSNITPATVTQTIDVRADPGVDSGLIVSALNDLLQENLGRDCSGQVDLIKLQVKTYTGLDLEVDDLVPGYALPVDDPWLNECRTRLEQVLGQDLLEEVAPYTCDASRLYQAGIPTVIFGPGDIGVAHTTGEKISVDQFLESVVGYMALVL